MEHKLTRFLICQQVVLTTRIINKIDQTKYLSIQLYWYYHKQSFMKWMDKFTGTDDVITWDKIHNSSVRLPDKQIIKSIRRLVHVSVEGGSRGILSTRRRGLYSITPHVWGLRKRCCRIRGWAGAWERRKGGKDFMVNHEDVNTHCYQKSILL